MGHYPLTRVPFTLKLFENPKGYLQLPEFPNNIRLYMKSDIRAAVLMQITD